MVGGVEVDHALVAGGVDLREFTAGFDGIADFDMCLLDAAFDLGGKAGLLSGQKRTDAEEALLPFCSADFRERDGQRAIGPAAARGACGLSATGKQEKCDKRRKLHGGKDGAESRGDASGHRCARVFGSRIAGCAG